MPNSVRGSAGGKAMAQIQKEQARLRIDEYNKNPNLCKYCGNPILAPYDKKLKDTKKKKFCSKSCAAKFNNQGKIHNVDGKGLHRISSLIDNYSNEEILNIFNSSINITDFSKKLGYKKKIGQDNKHVLNKLNELNLSLDILKDNNVNILNLTKGEIFERYKLWQTARSAIQKHARKIYENSEKTKQCVVCGYDKHYEVAHIKAVSDFQDNSLISEINDIDNLIALCPNHHWEYDNTDFDISKYIA